MNILLAIIRGVLFTAGIYSITHGPDTSNFLVFTFMLLINFFVFSCFFLTFDPKYSTQETKEEMA